MNLKTINKTSYCYYFIEVGVIIKCSGLENKLAEQRLCDPQVLLCRSSWRLKLRLCSTQAAALRPGPAPQPAGRCWELGMWLVPSGSGIIPSSELLPPGDFGGGVPRNTQPCLFLPCGVRAAPAAGPQRPLCCWPVCVLSPSRPWVPGGSWRGVGQRAPFRVVVLISELVVLICFRSKLQLYFTGLPKWLAASAVDGAPGASCPRF